jgi:hypothetical protein
MHAWRDPSNVSRLISVPELTIETPTHTCEVMSTDSDMEMLELAQAAPLNVRLVGTDNSHA